MESCKTCKYWKKHETIHESQQAWGECRRHSPTVNSLGAHWPTVPEVAWCGEYWDGQPLTPISWTYTTPTIVPFNATVVDSPLPQGD